MNEIIYDFVELESDESFLMLGEAFNGLCSPTALLFNNSQVKGEIIKVSTERGIWVRKWRLTVLEKITLNRKPASDDQEKKFSIVYFLNPSLFDLRSKKQRIKVGNRQTNILLSGSMPMQFAVLPKQPFYVLDITFTLDWLLSQFRNNDTCYKERLLVCLDEHMTKVFIGHCAGNDCKILHELEEYIRPEYQDILFVRSATYSLVCGFFTQLLQADSSKTKQTGIHYDQMVLAEKLISQQPEVRPRVDEIAKAVNMSVSTLLRQFKSMYGKSIYDYHIEKKMRLAKKMLIEENLAIKDVARALGYKQVTPFIESFTKKYGCTPGSLKGT